MTRNTQPLVSCEQAGGTASNSYNNGESAFHTPSFELMQYPQRQKPRGKSIEKAMLGNGSLNIQNVAAYQGWDPGLALRTQ